MSHVIQKTVTVVTNSSMIKEMTYDRADFRLYVTFRNGGRYAYDGVPETLFNKMIGQDNDSIGKYFYANIRKYPGLYPYTRLDT